MRFISTVLFAAAAVLADTPAHANPIAGLIKEQLDQGGLERQVAELTIAFMAEGIMWAQVYNKQTGAPSIYCPPAQLGVTDDQYVNIFETYMESHQDKQDLPVGLIIILAMQELFPCDE